MNGKIDEGMLDLLLPREDTIISSKTKKVSGALHLPRGTG